MDKKTTRITVIGAGGVGSILIDLLKSVGYRRVHIIDNDTVEEKNLKRQLFSKEDVGESKAKVIAERYKYTYEHGYFTEDSREQGILISCVDNNASRKAIADQPNDIKIFCANETLDAEAYLGCPETYHINANAFDPSLDNNTGAHCDEEESDPQTKIANTTAAIACMQLLEAFSEELWAERHELIPIMIKNCGPFFTTMRLKEVQDECKRNI